MRTRFVAYAVVVALVILTIIFGKRPSQRSVITESTPSEQTTSNASVTSPATSNSTTQGIPNASSHATSGPIAIPSLTASRPSPQKALENVVEGKNVPVEFYGRVIDQDGNPLSSVDVKVVVVQLTIPDARIVDISARNIPVEQITDTDGRFKINGMQGASFDLESLEKDGYEAEPAKRSRGPTGGTFDQPVIFKMWKANAHEQLITGEKKYQIVPDGRSYFIDLSTGIISETGGGDLKVWIKYPSQVTKGQLYDWSSEVNVLSGGLLEEDDLNATMFLAPADGYKPSFQVRQQIKGGQYGLTGEKRFYVILKNGQEYGRIAINLYAPYTDQIAGLIRISYAINPSGSRILR